MFVPDTVGKFGPLSDSLESISDLPREGGCHGVVPPGRDEGHIGPPRPALIYDTGSMAISH